MTKMNTSCVCDVLRGIIGFQARPLTSDLRVSCQGTCVRVRAWVQVVRPLSSLVKATNGSADHW